MFSLNMSTFHGMYMLFITDYVSETVSCVCTVVQLNGKGLKNSSEMTENTCDDVIHMLTGLLGERRTNLKFEKLTY